MGQSQSHVAHRVQCGTIPRTDGLLRQRNLVMVALRPGLTDVAHDDCEPDRLADLVPGPVRNRLLPIDQSLRRRGGAAQLYGGNGPISKRLDELYGGI
jgi:hypothetical protein